MLFITNKSGGEAGKAEFDKDRTEIPSSAFHINYN